MHTASCCAQQCELWHGISAARMKSSAMFSTWMKSSQISSAWMKSHQISSACNPLSRRQQVANTLTEHRMNSKNAVAHFYSHSHRSLRLQWFKCVSCSEKRHLIAQSQSARECAINDTAATRARAARPCRGLESTAAAREASACKKRIGCRGD